VGKMYITCSLFHNPTAIMWAKIGGELVLPDRKGVSEVVPEGRTVDHSLINIFSPKIVGERSIFHYHFFLPLFLFNLRHWNIFKICPTKLYGYSRWDRDRGYHPPPPPPPPHTHARVVSSLFSKSVLNWWGRCLHYDILEILNFVGFFLIIVRQTFKIMLIKNNCR
jgi:hypothetical protein